MKKVTLIIAISCILSSMVTLAQTMSYGVKGSLNMSSLYVNDDGFGNFKTGFGAGGFFQYNVLDALGVSLEPMYMQKGANNFNYQNLYSEFSPAFVDQVTGEPFDFKLQQVSLSVIEVPVMGHFIMHMGGMNARLFAGPTFDFLLFANYLKERVDDGKNIYTAEDITDRFDYYDIGAKAGLGIDLNLSPLVIRVDLSYRYGFTDINNTVGKPAFFNNNVSLSLGIGMAN